MCSFLDICASLFEIPFHTFDCNRSLYNVHGSMYIYIVYHTQFSVSVEQHHAVPAVGNWLIGWSRVSRGSASLLLRLWICLDWLCHCPSIMYPIYWLALSQFLFGCLASPRGYIRMLLLIRPDQKIPNIFWPAYQLREWKKILAKYKIGI